MRVLSCHIHMNLPIVVSMLFKRADLDVLYISNSFLDFLEKRLTSSTHFAILFDTGEYEMRSLFRKFTMEEVTRLLKIVRKKRFVEIF